jgi:hypothetical protein
MSFLSAAGLALNLMSMAQSNKADKVARQAEIESARFSAASLRRKAEISRQGFGQREEQQRRDARILAGKRRAAIAQSGTGFDGSNADVERQSQIFAELDALNIRYQGELENHGLLEQANQYDLAARGVVSLSNAEQMAGRINMAGTLLAGSDKMKFSLNNRKTSGPAPMQYSLQGSYPVLS